MRRSSRVFVLFGIAIIALFLAMVDAARLSARHDPVVRLMQGLVEHLQVTDLCLFTEARYTRHPSQADLHSAFMDHPLAFEHFPSGGLIEPPFAMRNHENLD